MNNDPVKVLLVEDSLADTDLIREMLEEVKGFTFDLERVERLSSGLDRLAQGDIDLVLLDLSLPDSRGLDTFVRAHRQVPQVPLIVLTGLDDESVAISAVRQGAQDYLVKGQVNGSLLVRSMRYALERKQAEEALRQYAERLEILHQIDQAILSAQSPRAIADAALERIRQLVPCQRAEVVTFDFDSREAVWLAAHADGKGDRGMETRIALDDLEITRAFQQGEPHVTTDPGSPSQPPPIVTALRVEEMRSYISAPLLAQAQLIGVLSLGATSANAFEPLHVAIAQEAAASIATALQQTRLYEQVRQHAEELAAAVEKLEELDRLKNEFIQNVSHELRSPLTLIQGYAEMLEAGDLGSLDEQQQESAAIIARRARMLGHLVNDIMLILEAESRPPKLEPVLLDQLVRISVEEFQIAAQKAELTLRAQIEENIPPVKGCPAYLQRVLDNLLSNAVKFTPEGGSITLHLWRAADQVKLEVADTGIGIPAEQLDRIFDRFYQVDGSARRQYGGMGLGLALIKELVEACGGKVSVDSAVGEGSTFTLTLPIAQDAGPTAGAQDPVCVDSLGNPAQ